MFISEEEAQARLRSNDNLLNRLKPKQEPVYADEDPEALEEAHENPTSSAEDDVVRLAVLAGRRHLKTTDQRGGRYPQQGAIPPIFRSLIGAAAKIGTVKGTARAFGVSEQSVNNYKAGKTTGTAPVDGKLLQSIENDTLGIRKQVLGVLAFTVAGITPESIENKDPKELSIIARNLSSIMAATKPPADIGDKTTNAQVIVFSPEQQEEHNYKTIEIG